MGGLLESITRADVLACLRTAGFHPLLRPTVRNLVDFAREAGSTASSTPEVAEEVLQWFHGEHADVAARIEREVREQGLTIAQRQAVEGPYRHLADLLAEFLVRWNDSAPFGEDTLLVGLVFCEHILAMHNLTVTLAYPDEHLRGAVIAWCQVLAGERTAQAEDPRANLRNAILGRLRFAVD